MGLKEWFEMSVRAPSNFSLLLLVFWEQGGFAARHSDKESRGVTLSVLSWEEREKNKPHTERYGLRHNNITSLEVSFLCYVQFLQLQYRKPWVQCMCSGPLKAGRREGDEGRKGRRQWCKVQGNVKLIRADGFLPPQTSTLQNPIKCRV